MIENSKCSSCFWTWIYKYTRTHVQVQTYRGTRSSNVLNPRPVTLVTCSVRWYESRIQKFFTPFSAAGTVHEDVFRFPCFRLCSRSHDARAIYIQPLHHSHPRYCTLAGLGSPRFHTRRPDAACFAVRSFVTTLAAAQRRRKNGEKVGQALGRTRTWYHYRKQYLQEKKYATRLFTFLLLCTSSDASWFLCRMIFTYFVSVFVFVGANVYRRIHLNTFY